MRHKQEAAEVLSGLGGDMQPPARADSQCASAALSFLWSRCEGLLDLEDHLAPRMPFLQILMRPPAFTMQHLMPAIMVQKRQWSKTDNAPGLRNETLTQAVTPLLLDTFLISKLYRRSLDTEPPHGTI